MGKPKLIVFASGTRDGGGSGFENLVSATKSGDLDADIVAVVSNHEHGGVRKRAGKLGVPFEYFPGPFDAEHYRKIIETYCAEWIAASGWLKRIVGLDPARTFNIHPALLSFQNGRFGGPGHYGHHIHEKVKEALENGELSESGFTMHFTTDEYDRGPIFFEYRVPLKKGMTADDIAKAVNIEEHRFQPKVTGMVVRGQIRWDGRDPTSLVVPANFT